MSKNKQDLKKKDVVQAVVIDDLLCDKICPKGSKTPKSLLPLANIPVLDYTLSCLSAAGVEETLLFMTMKSPALEEHLRLSNWSEPGTMAVKVVVCNGCHNFGDLMRDLEASHAIQGDFFLLFADTVCTADLKPILEKHKANTLRDKNAVITMVYSQLLPGHASRSEESELVLALDNGRVVAEKRIDPSESIFPVSVDLLQRHSNIELHYDIFDPCISVCSLTVPIIFADNFDFETRDDFVRELLLNEELLGHTMYAHILEGAYASRACNPPSYLSTTMDILKRWTFPLTPDASFSLTNGSYFYDIMSNNCKQADVRIGRSEVQDCVIGAGTKLGSNCDIRMSVVGKNCIIGDNVKLKNAIFWDNSSIESNYEGNNILVFSGMKIKNTGGAQPVKIPDALKTEKGDKFKEIYDSETDSSDDELEGTAQVDEYEIFFNEVLDSLSRGFSENLLTDDLMVEINSSRFANNIQAEELGHWVARVIFSIPAQVGDSVDKVLKYFKPIFAKYIRTAEDQINCLTAMEQVIENLADCAKIIGYLYNCEILEEENIISWYDDYADDAVKEQQTMTTFMNWLQTADEESDESD